MNILKINQNQLKNQIGEIVPLWYQGKDCITAYLDGGIPIKIKTSLSQEEFDSIVGGLM